MRALEAISIGQARSEVALAASQTAQDYELRHGGDRQLRAPSRRSRPCSGSRDQYAVVTRERTTATNTTAYQGLPAGVAPDPGHGDEADGGRWVVSGWQPES